MPDNRKGLFPTHSAAVAKQLAGAHVTIQARHDADVTPTFILKRVADSSGARYSVHNEPAQRYVAPTPVGSSYVPVGRPEIKQTKPVAPPSAVGTSYESKRNELSEIRAAQSAKKSSTPDFDDAPAPPPAPAAPPKPATAPTTSGMTVSEPATPPPVQPSGPASVPSPPQAPSASSGSAPSAPASETVSDRPGPVGTAYTPVQLPKPGKLANRWQEVVNQSEPEKKPSLGTRSSTGGGMTWSQRQEAARKQREEEDAASRAAGEATMPENAKTAAAAAVGGTAAVGLAAGATLGVGAGIAGAAAAGVGAAAVKSAVDSKEEEEEEEEEQQEQGGAPPPPPPPPAAPAAPPAPPAPLAPGVDDKASEPEVCLLEPLIWFPGIELTSRLASRPRSKLPRCPLAEKADKICTLAAQLRVSVVSFAIWVERCSRPATD